jgi:hypothetical protein
VSKLTEQLRSVGIVNPWQFAGRGNVYIDYTPANNGRGGRSARWQVTRPGFRTDPNGAWYNNGHKTFWVYSRADKEPKLFEAKAWASERYGIKEWARTPFGSWMDAEFVKKRLAELKSAQPSADETEGK